MPPQRESPRHRVHLAVRYETAREFVQEYAENLSNRGLFITGAHDLEPGRRVAVRIDLPGYGETQVQAEVAHVITPDQAAEHKRPAGAGLTIVDAPLGFDAILKAYLWRLGRRKDHIIMTADEPSGLLLGATGYRIQRVPPADELAARLARAEHPVVGILVPMEQLPRYMRATRGTAAEDLVQDLEQFADFDAMLTAMDNELLRLLRQKERESRQDM